MVGYWPIPLYLKNPAKASKHTVASLISANLLLILAFCTMACNILVGNGAFFCTGLAHALLRPSRVAHTSGSAVGDTKPAKVWTHDKQFTASSTAALVCLDSPRCCKYNATWQGSPGTTEIYDL